MSNSTVNEILARCVVSPAFLEQLATNPAEALAGYTLDARTYSDFLALDVRRLRHFAGVVTKVQNNGLWQWLPDTRAVLVHYGLDLDVFVAYRELHQAHRAQRKASRNEQTRQFITFLREYLHARGYESSPGLRDILAHESFTWEIRAALEEAGPSGESPSIPDVSSLDASRFRSLVPRIQGVLRLAHFTYDASEISSLLAARTFGAARLTHRPRWLGYWGHAGTQELRILEMDESLVKLLKEVDGQRTVRTLIQRVGRGLPEPLPPARFRAFIEAAFHMDLFRPALLRAA